MCVCAVCKRGGQESRDCIQLFVCVCCVCVLCVCVLCVCVRALCVESIIRLATP